MKLLLTCHTEYDLCNRFGPAETLPVPQQTFKHLPVLRDMVKGAGIRMTWALMTGGACGDRLIRFVAGDRRQWRETGELAIHFHPERYRDGRWVFDGFMRPEEYETHIRNYREQIHEDPRTVVFGKWKVDQSILSRLKDQGIDHEGTRFFPEKMITRPVLGNGLIAVPPVVAFDGKPLNPFTQISHWLYFNKIVKRLHGRNLLVHIGFHSYDLFAFKGHRPRLKRQKVLVWKNLLGLLKKYDVGTLILSEVRPEHWEERDHLGPGYFSRLFNRFRH